MLSNRLLAGLALVLGLSMPLVASAAGTARAATSNAPVAAGKPAASRAPASTAAGAAAAAAVGSGTRDIGKELRVTGQSRSLSMGLLFQKDKDKLVFGTPRTSYKDKILAGGSGGL